MDREMQIEGLSSWNIFGKTEPAVIAGPCSAESESQVLRSAEGVKEAGVNVFRAGLWKPRTRPGSFEGVGAEGLPWLRRVKDTLGMKTAVEVALPEHVRMCLDAGVDMVWTGARTSVNPFLMDSIAQALSGTDIPVLVKNPVNPDMDLWAGAVERLYDCGLRRIGVVHRGFSVHGECVYRNPPLWKAAIGFRARFPQIPFFCDPSHMGGSRMLVGTIAQQAMDLGFDGLMIEAHCAPEEALSDSGQQLDLQELVQLLSSLSVRHPDNLGDEYRRTIMPMRSELDDIDSEIVGLLAERTALSMEIGREKLRHNVSILQIGRWRSVLKSVVEQGSERGLDPEFVEAVFNVIHQYSVSVQNKISVK